MRYCELRILCCRDYVTKFAPSNATFEHLVANKTYFKEKFTQFLFSPKGGIYQVKASYDTNHRRFSASNHFQPNFWFSSKLVCGEPAPDVLLQAIPFQHKRFFRWIFFVFVFVFICMCVFISVCVLCCVCLSLCPAQAILQVNTLSIVCELSKGHKTFAKEKTMKRH